MISIKYEQNLSEFISKTKDDDNNLEVSFEYPCSDHNACFPYEIQISKGFYFLQCWDASGSYHRSSPGGYGGYSSGIFIAKHQTTLYLHIGGSVNYTGQFLKPAYNGQLKSGNNAYDCVGGGATDFRLKYGKWTENFESRIIVAGGGGAGRPIDTDKGVVDCKGGNGGGINGEPGEGVYLKSPYGMQTSSSPTESNPNATQKHGSFGYGFAGQWSSGGGGWYGGGSVTSGASGGGSGYVQKLVGIGKYKRETITSNHIGNGIAKLTVLTETSLYRLLFPSFQRRTYNRISVFFFVFTQRTC